MFMLGLDNKKACVRVRLLMRPGQRHYYLAFICQLICDVIMFRSAVESTLRLLPSSLVSMNHVYVQIISVK